MSIRYKVEAQRIRKSSLLFISVLALYPQTTCFYKAVVTAVPVRHDAEYEVQFEDNTYTEGYSPPLKVAQRYVIAYPVTRVPKKKILS